MSQSRDGTVTKSKFTIPLSMCWISLRSLEVFLEVYFCSTNLIRVHDFCSELIMSIFISDPKTKKAIWQEER